MSYQKFKDYRLGEEHLQKNGLMAKITGYHSASDMTVQFEDGKVIEHVSYHSFINGTLNYNKRNMPERVHSYKVGERIVCSNEMVATIIAYRNSQDIDIQFDDGYVVEHVKYTQFYQAGIQHPDHKPVMWPYKPEKHIGLRKRTVDGYRELLAVHEDGTIDFIDDDGTIVHNGSYRYDFLWHNMSFFNDRPRKKRNRKDETMEEDT